jgi:hypothetical protein
MKTQIVQSHKIQNDRIVPVHKSKLILEASERYEIFQEKFLDSGLQIQTTFEEKNSDLILALIQSSRPISDINHLPKPVVVCTATLVEGNNKVLSATADAPTSFTAPYKAAETMALTRLFDRLGIPSIVHEHEIGDTKNINDNWQNGATDSIPLTGTNELPVDLAKIPSREDIKAEIDASTIDTQVQTSEPVVETDTDFSLTSDSVVDENSEPEFPSDIPKPFHIKLVAKLQLLHGDDWVNHIPSSKQEAYSVLGIR